MTYNKEGRPRVDAAERLPYEPPPVHSDGEQYQLQLSASDEERQTAEQLAEQQLESERVQQMAQQLTKDYPEKAIPLLSDDQPEKQKTQVRSSATVSANVSVARATTVMTRAQNLQRRVTTTARMLATYLIAMINIY